MMRKPKFRFNPETLNYEIVKPSSSQLFIKFFATFSVVFLIGFLSVALFSKYFPSYAEQELQNEIAAYETQFKILSKKAERLANRMKELEEIDDQVYREIFGVDPIEKSIKEAGIGGRDKYKSLNALKSGDKLAELHKKLDKLSAVSNVQESSYDELIKLAKNKSKLLASIPAIQPVSNKELKRIASGFGTRIDPIYKTRKMHSGIDFSAPKGAKVYATGDGTVSKVKYDRWGYGTHIVINHGYGYQTLYAHLSDAKVKNGQKVSRGQLIGNVGSTGKSTGPHLHYEVIKNGQKVNPVGFFFNDITNEQYEELLKIAEHPNQSFD
jgi:murein DD-endopeptidase MepM/ murein hydrolase activator NlpD